MEHSRILIVEDETIVAMEMEDVLTSWGYKISGNVGSGKQAIERAKDETPDLILMDINLEGDIDGIETSQIIKETSNVPIIFITAYADEEKLNRAKQIVPYGYLLKPVQDMELKVAVEMAVHASRVEKERSKFERQQQLSQLRSDAILALYQMTAPSNQKILDFCLQKSLLITESELSFIGLISKDERVMTIHSWSESAMESCSIPAPPSRFLISEAGLWGEVIRQRQPIVVNNYAQDHIVKKDVPKGHVTIENFMSIPVFESGSIVCVVAVANKPVDYDASDVEQLRLLMDGAWQIVKQVRFEQEKAELQKQVQQMQKMEAIGTLAGGIAHDFNNILHPILGYLKLCEKHTHEEEKLKKYLSHIATSADRAKNLVSQILMFASKSSQIHKPLKPNAIIKEIVPLLTSSIPSTIQIEVTLEQDEGQIKADGNQIHQVLMNLATNAYHAMQEQGGILTIRSREVELSPEDLPIAGLTMGIYRCISVSDTGIGMSKEVKDRICDPYYTTKEKGKGTGLGLAIVSGIIKDHGGSMTIGSELGRGSEFTVYLPVIGDEGEQRKPVYTNQDSTGDEHILVIDDEKVIAELEATMLEGLGYQVTQRTSAITALELFRENPAQFDLVITDMTMPAMTGDQLTKEMLAIRPNLPVIICTGFSERINEEKAMHLGAKAFLMKPVSLNQFTVTIREVLGKQQKTVG